METDYSEAGRSLVANLVSQWGGAWWGENVNKMDCLYTDPDTGRESALLPPLNCKFNWSPTPGGSVYVGGWEAAENLSLLEEAGISRVVNCTTDLQSPHTQAIRSVSTNVFYSLQYFNSSNFPFQQFSLTVKALLWWKS